MTITDKPKLKEGSLHPELAAQLQAEYEDALQKRQDALYCVESARNVLIKARAQLTAAETRHGHLCGLVHGLQLMLAKAGMPVKEERQ